MARRVVAVAHPTGLDVIIGALAAPVVRCPAEGSNRDEAALPLSQADADQDLSELARGPRYARRLLTINNPTTIMDQLWSF